jgi:hypothetical protein
MHRLVCTSTCWLPVLVYCIFMSAGVSDPIEACRPGQAWWSGRYSLYQVACAKWPKFWPFNSKVVEENIVMLKFLDYIMKINQNLVKMVVENFKKNRPCHLFPKNNVQIKKLTEKSPWVQAYPHTEHHQCYCMRIEVVRDLWECYSSLLTKLVSKCMTLSSL